MEMLVLTRKKNETIVIDGHIKIKILRVRGNRIRLGIDAPLDLQIRRGEISDDHATEPQSLAIHSLSVQN